MDIIERSYLLSAPEGNGVTVVWLILGPVWYHWYVREWHPQTGGICITQEIEKPSFKQQQNMVCFNDSSWTFLLHRQTRVCICCMASIFFQKLRIHWKQCWVFWSTYIVQYVHLCFICHCFCVSAMIIYRQEFDFLVFVKLV